MLKDWQEEKKTKIFFPNQIEKLVNITRDSGMQVGNFRFLIKRKREATHRKKQSVSFWAEWEKKSAGRDTTLSA